MPKAAFVFPAASGHTNPSLPLARALVERGWDVDYLHSPQFQEAIEDTGATFVNRDLAFKDLGIDDYTAMVKATLIEYGAAAPWALNFGSIAAQRLLPVYVRWLQSRGADLVVYCPVLSQVAHFASVKLAIPDVSLLTAAGPGFFDAAIASTPGAPSADALIAAIKGSEPNLKAVEALKAEMGMPELTLNTETGLPLICDYYAATNLVTTTPELADTVSKRDEEYYSKVGKKFVYVGPLLDVAGAKRAGGMLHAGSSEADSSPPDTEALMARVAEAAESGAGLAKSNSDAAHVAAFRLQPPRA